MPRRLIASIVLIASLPAIPGPVFAQCGLPGDCLSVHPSPGCVDVDCCTSVCTSDPTCCAISWDVNCVVLANSLCVGLCGATASGSCFLPHPTPACDQRECCQMVCAIDPYCCDGAWDFTCAVLASIQCPTGGGGTCGDPDSGPCDQPHPTPACEDQACCELVCSIDPTCCSQSWDFICAAAAGQYCVEACEPGCPSGSVTEDEDCGQDFNNPCYGTPSPSPTIQTLGGNVWGCGQLASSPGGFRDIDVWGFTASDVDGDGLVAVRISLASSFDGFAALVPAPCGAIASAVASVETDFCVEQSSVLTCVAPGAYRLVVAAGAFPVPGNPDLPCGQFGATRYGVRVESLPSGCGPACGKGAGSCFEPRKQPGCEDPECCDAVCARDPACCDVQWDSGCVQSAQVLCATPPVNDECVGAIYVPADDPTEVVNIGATAGSPGFPSGCGGDAAGADVWYRTVAPRTGSCTVTTCGSGSFDTVVAVYPACGGTPIGCNDNAPQCIPSTSSRVTFVATCGEEYLIRVGSIGGEPGTAILSVNFGPGPGCSCPADLDGDGIVGGSDLTEVLSSWGGPGADLDGDGTTNASDLTVLLSAWGACP